MLFINLYISLFTLNIKNLVMHQGKMPILIAWKSLSRYVFQKKILGFINFQSLELTQFWNCHKNSAAEVTGNLCLVAT